MGGGSLMIKHQINEPMRTVPHPRTLRKAREQIKYMVEDGFSIPKIRNYLYRWAMWWVNASNTWQHHELLKWFLDSCWDVNLAAYAEGLLLRYIKTSHTAMTQTPAR